jgi:hypothetical protein
MLLSPTRAAAKPVRRTRRGTPSPELVCGSGLACRAAYRDLALGGESRALVCRREKECVPPASRGPEPSCEDTDRSTHTVQSTCVLAAGPPHAPSTRPASARPRSVVAAAQRPSIWNQTIWDAQAGGPGCSAHLARVKSCRGSLVSGTGPAASTAFFSSWKWASGGGQQGLGGFGGRARRGRDALEHPCAGPQASRPRAACAPQLRCI